MQADRLTQWLKGLPNKLTLARILVIPILLLIYPWESQVLRTISAILFAIAGATDFFDGYLARKYDSVTKIGAILDPISDKILIASAIILLASTGQLPAWIAVIVICREIAISGLRLAAKEYGIAIEVNQYGKIKTAAQGLAILLLMLSMDELKTWGMLMMWVSIGFSYYSAYLYWTGFWRNIPEDLNKSFRG